MTKRKNTPVARDIAAFDYGEAAPLNVTDWGVPDWRDGSAYPEADDMTPRRWAWEFLRRNPEYRLDWTEDTGKELARGITPDQIPERRRHWRKYGLSWPLDPTKSVDDPPFMRLGPRGLRTYNGPGAVTIRAGELAIVFDLNGSARDQIKKATAMLRSRSKFKNVRVRHEQFSTYLRVLDAKWAFDTEQIDETIKQIAAIIWPKQVGGAPARADKWETYIDTAESLRWQGYFRFAMIRDRRGRRGHGK